jgi:fatty acid desaturase
MRAALRTLVFAIALVVSLALPLDYASTISLPMVVIAAGIAAVGLTGGVVRPAYVAVAVGCL